MKAAGAFRAHVVAGPRPRGRDLRRDDVEYGRLGDARRHGRPDAAAARMGRQRRQADLFRHRSTTAPTSSARRSIPRELLGLHQRRALRGARADIGGDPKEPWVRIAWKLSIRRRIRGWADANLGAIGALYNLTMDPFEKYDMIFNGAAPSRIMTTSPGRYSGQDNGWVGALVQPVIIDFDTSIMKFPNIPRYVGGASNDTSSRPAASRKPRAAAQAGTRAAAWAPLNND